MHFGYLVEEGKISEADAAAFREYVGFAGANSTFTSYIYAKLGLIGKDEGFEATSRVLEALSLHRIDVDRKSAQPYEEQFWEQYDVIMELSEDGLARELPAFVTDPTNKAKVDAIIAGRKGFVQETSERLQVSA